MDHMKSSVVSFVVLLCVNILQHTAASSSSTMTVTIDVAQDLSAPLPSDFASISAEVPCASQFISAAGDSYIHLLQYLKNASGGSRGPNIRIGGNSADWTWYSNVVNATLPKGDTNQVSLSDISVFTRVAEWQGTMTIDINLMNQTDPSNAVAYAMAAYQNIPTALIDGFEIGNEPDLFMDNGIRGSNYSFGDYQQDFSFYVKALMEAGLPLPWIQGAVICCNWWDANMSEYVDRFSTYPTNVLTSMSHHYYPMSGVSATFEKLLATDAAVGVQQNAAIAADSVARGIPFYIGEGNSAYTGGKEGVSNSFATALWAVDTMFYAAAASMTRFNFHGCPGRTYTPITNDVDPVTNESFARARPLYYGMLAFTEAIAYEANVVAASVSSAMVEGNVQAWATVTPNHPFGTRLCVVLLQKNLTTFEAVNITIAAGEQFSLTSSRITHIHPQDHFVNATWNISYGGLSFDDSRDGLPLGTRTYDRATADENGNVDISVQPASIVLVELFTAPW